MKKTLPYPIREARLHLRDALAQPYIPIPDSKNRAYGSMQYGEDQTTFTLKIHEERLFVTNTARPCYRGTLKEAGDETLLETHMTVSLSFYLTCIITFGMLVAGWGALPITLLMCAVIWVPTLIHFSEDCTDLDKVLEMIFLSDLPDS